MCLSYNLEIVINILCCNEGRIYIFRNQMNWIIINVDLIEPLALKGTVQVNKQGE